MRAQARHERARTRALIRDNGDVRCARMRAVATNNAVTCNNARTKCMDSVPCT